MSVKPVKIILVEDHRIVRDGIRFLLEEQNEVEIVGEAANGLKALELLEENEVEVAVVDLNMPVMNGLQTTEAILSRFPHVRVLALTMHDDEQNIKGMLKAGASGYVIKNAGVDELVNAIRTIAGGGNYFSAEATRAVMMDLVNPQEEKPAPTLPLNVTLTDREMEVLKLIVEENTNQEIAEKLFISIRTVDTHRRNLLQKTGARNTAGLVRFAIERGII